MEKLLTFAVPCYNSQDYMEHCVETLLTGGEEVEIILVDDGSKDNTGAIADRLAAAHPTVIKVIHQENGGHGEGVNQGVRNASGLYYKVVDSDDWADVDALKAILDKLREFSQMAQPVDLLVANYVYEHVEDHTQKPINYRNVFPQDRIFTWEEVGRFNPDQYILMHSVFYRTELLRECGMELPKHTFYVDNIFVYQPLPFVKTLYYMDVDFYRYFIGRADQSVNESVMMGRIDQQLRITKIMLASHDLHAVTAREKRLGNYMFNYLAMMMTISSIFLIMDGSPAALAKKTELWESVRQRDWKLHHRLKYRSLAAVCNLPGKPGRELALKLYRLTQKIYKFN